MAAPDLIKDLETLLRAGLRDGEGWHVFLSEPDHYVVTLADGAEVGITIGNVFVDLHYRPYGDSNMLMGIETIANVNFALGRQKPRKTVEGAVKSQDGWQAIASRLHTRNIGYIVSEIRWLVRVGEVIVAANKAAEEAFRTTFDKLIS